MNYTNTLPSPRERGRRGGRAEGAPRDQILDARIETVAAEISRKGGNALESLTRGSGSSGMEQSIEPSFFVGPVAWVTSIDSASIGSQANYGLDPVALGILSDGVWKLAFHLFDSAASTISFFVADAVSEGRSGRKRWSEGG